MVMVNNSGGTQNGSTDSSPFASNVVVFGSVVQDMVSYVGGRFPSPGESVRGSAFRMFCSGKGANQAVAAARLGARVAMVAMVGEDEFGTTNINSLRGFGVDTVLVYRSESGQMTATATININDEGENAIVVCLGANLELSAKHAKMAEEVIAQAKILLCQSEVDQEGNVEAFRIARKHGVLTFFNAAPGRGDLDERLLPLADIVCVNENEAAFLIGPQNKLLSTREDFEEAAKAILRMGPSVSIITLGPKGVILATKQPKTGKVQTSFVKVERVKAVDTVGAGDCFCGSLAYFLASSALDKSNVLLEESIIEMVEKASRIATISVQRQGSQISYPCREELSALGILED